MVSWSEHCKQSKILDDKGLQADKKALKWIVSKRNYTQIGILFYAI